MMLTTFAKLSDGEGDVINRKRVCSILQRVWKVFTVRVAQNGVLVQIMQLVIDSTVFANAQLAGLVLCVIKVCLIQSLALEPT